MSLHGKVDGVNAGLATFAAELRNDPVCAESVEALVIEFGGASRVVSPWSDPNSLVVPTLVANGGTPLGQALEILLRELRSEVRLRVEEGDPGDYGAHVWLFSDGNPTDQWEHLLPDLHNEPRISAINAFAIGPDADLEILRRIVGGLGNVFEIVDLTPERIRATFRWVTQVTRTVSTSRLAATSSNVNGGPSTVAAPNPPAGVTIRF